MLDPGPRHAGEDLFEDGFEDGFNADGYEQEYEAADDWSDAERVEGWDFRSTAVRGGDVRPAVQGQGRSGPGLVRRFWEERFGGWSFGPPQLAVIVVIVLLGLGLAGWSVLRARPVALASGQPAGVGSATPQATSTASAPTSPRASAASSSATASTPPTSAAQLIKVHVLGAVKHPGVVTLAVGSRVQDALDRAGGVTKAAHLGDLNLAQPIADGQQIFVARDGGRSEVRDPVTVPAGGGGSPGSDPSTGGSAAATSGSASGAPVNLNTATVDQLDQLPGVGPVTAQKIVDWRTQHGRFDSTEELQEVDGIGPKTYADLASMVTV